MTLGGIEMGDARSRWEQVAWRAEHGQRVSVSAAGGPVFDPWGHRTRIAMLDARALNAQRKAFEIGEIECVADSMSFSLLVSIVDEATGWAEALRQELVG